MPDDTLTIDRRFRGPLDSANGGYAAGLLASRLAGGVAVTLRRPPPLGRPLAVRRDGDVLVLEDVEGPIAEAVAGDPELEAPAPPSRAQAAAAADGIGSWGPPAFAECFVCGVRADGSGLGLHPGAVPGREGLVATTWDAREVAVEIVWAAIDCPGAYATGDSGGEEIVLGRMTARIDRMPEEGEQCVVAGWPLGRDGRKLFAGTALYGVSGEVLALARQVWIAPRSS